MARPSRQRLGDSVALEARREASAIDEPGVNERASTLTHRDVSAILFLWRQGAPAAEIAVQLSLAAQDVEAGFGPGVFPASRPSERKVGIRGNFESPANGYCGRRGAPALESSYCVASVCLPFVARLCIRRSSSASCVDDLSDPNAPALSMPVADTATFGSQHSPPIGRHPGRIGRVGTRQHSDTPSNGARSHTLTDRQIA
jgi:hypothetical protein